MSFKPLLTLSAIVLSSYANASYNGVIYIPTSVKYDIERGLLHDLKYIKTNSRYVSYWSKSSFKSFCDSADNTMIKLNTEVQKLSNKFISESDPFSHKGRIEINNAILNLEKVITSGLAPISSACRDQRRMKEDQARSLTSNMGQIESNYYRARNKLSSLIKNYGEVIRVYKSANTSNFNGSYTGHQGWLTGYEQCEVNVKVKGKTVEMKYSDPSSEFSLTRNLVGMSHKKEVLENFAFDREIETSTICSIKGTSFANLNYENYSLKEFRATHRRLKTPASGFGVVISCLNQDDEILEKVFAKRYKCLDLKKK